MKKERQKRATSKIPQKKNILLRYASLWLLLAAVLVYAKIFFLSGLTELDDRIFIMDKYDFNKHFSNISKVFGMGCFMEKDIYYRPILLVFFIVQEAISNHTLTTYHFASLLFHGINILLLFSLLKKLRIQEHLAFAFSLVYAVHPVLTMTVAWIPGTNDLILTTFALSFFHSILNYQRNQKTSQLILQLLFLLLAVFTKESGVFIPFVAILLLNYIEDQKLLSKKYLAVFSSWILALALWYFMRLHVLPESAKSIDSYAFNSFTYRLPGLLQYIGKIFLPFNLSVFPTVEDTTLLFGIIAFPFLVGLVALYKNRNNKLVLLGTGWFLFFILPFFLVPQNINDQLFEHRLYLPIIGIFILLSQSLVAKVPANKILLYGILICVAFSIITFNYINKFDGKVVFWENAVNDSPQSAYANKMYGIKLTEVKRNEDAIPYFKKAYELDSTERYTNLFLARLIYLPNNSIDSAYKALQNEIRLNPNFLDTYFEMAHVCYMRNDFEGAKANLVKYLSFKPDDPMANGNLLRLLMDTKDYKAAQQQITNMEQRGLPVSADIKASVNSQQQFPL